MVDDLAKACGTKKIIVLFNENTDRVSNIEAMDMLYKYKDAFSLRDEIVSVLT